MGKRAFLFRASGRSVRGKCTLHDVIYVRRERRCLHDPLQGDLRPRAPHRLHHAPILEGRGKSGRELGIPRVKCKHYVHDEIVAAAVGAVELLLVRQRKGMDQRAYAVGIGKREGPMLGQSLDTVECRRLRNNCLNREPFVDDQRIVGISTVKVFERGRTLWHLAERERRKRRHAIGHVVG